MFDSRGIEKVNLFGSDRSSAIFRTLDGTRYSYSRHHRIIHDRLMALAHRRLMNTAKPKPKLKWWQIALIVAFVPVIVAIAGTAFILFLVSTICLHITIWAWWCLRGRDILFVYSESPIWRDYIEKQILPHIGERAIVLNWSQRNRWRVSVARLAFHHFGGYRQFNPLAVVFRPFRRTRTFRFWQPFRDFKHGNPEALRQMESEFFGLIGVQKR
jgi:hypothetical protein